MILTTRLIFALVVLSGYPTLSMAKPATYNEKVEVNGFAYRVVMRGQQVKVITKTLAGHFRGRTVERRTEMRAAAAMVTGCHLVDDYWIENTLVGELECSDKPNPR